MQGDITLLFVTHSPEIAKAFCTRGVVMKNGKIVFDGTIDEAIDSVSYTHLHPQRNGGRTVRRAKA